MEIRMDSVFDNNNFMMIISILFVKSAQIFSR